MERLEADAADEPRLTQPLERGTNQSGVRLYNERLVLSLVRRHGALAKAEIARLTGLSPQTTTVIMNRLETDGLLVAGARLRGKVGQPSVPYSLAPDGAFTLGMMIGRRGCDLVLMDFVARFRKRIRLTYAYPTPQALLDFARQGIPRLVGALDVEQRDRIAGLGLAMPFELWSWGAEIGAPDGALEVWRGFDLPAELARFAPWPVQVFNDATAACAAEHTFGKGVQYRDFIYFFIGTFIGGGLVLQGNVVPGRSGNAGAFGSMPVLPRGGRESEQLIRQASIYTLEAALRASGIDAGQIWDRPDDWRGFEPALGAWIANTAHALAQACISAAAVIDFEAAVIDGIFPADVRALLVRAVADEVARSQTQGLTHFEVAEGSLGRDARTLGGATLPVLATFARDREVLFKS